MTTIDRFDVMIKQAKENFKRLGVEDKVTILEGNANDILPTLDEQYDFIFMDAAKGQYIKSCVVASTMGPGIKVNTSKYQ